MVGGPRWHSSELQAPQHWLTQLIYMQATVSLLCFAC